MDNQELQEKLKELREKRGQNKSYTAEQMAEDIKKYGLDKEYGIYIVEEGGFRRYEYSGTLVKKRDGKFEVLITEERGIVTSNIKVDTIEEARAYLVKGLRGLQSKEEYFRARSEAKKK